jgi:DNA-binding GntR family transcriptional regulator
MEAGCWSLPEHREILAALRARDCAAAARAAADHVRRGGRHILERLGSDETKS